MARKGPRKRAKRNPNVPEDIQKAIDRLYPAGLVELPFYEDSYFPDIRESLEKMLRAIKGVTLRFEREAEGVDDWTGDYDYDYDDFDDDFIGPLKPGHSYHLYFLSPNGKKFQFETEIETIPFEDDPEWEDDEWGDDEWEGIEAEDETRTYSGSGRIGLAVGVSLAAPIAIVRPSRHVVYENGNQESPTLERRVFETDDGNLVTENFRESLNPALQKALDKLSAQVAAILQSLNLRVIQEEECELVLPELRADPLLDIADVITVREAFFFSEIPF